MFCLRSSGEHPRPRTLYRCVADAVVCYKDKAREMQVAPRATAREISHPRDQQHPARTTTRMQPHTSAPGLAAAMHTQLPIPATTLARPRPLAPRPTAPPQRPESVAVRGGLRVLEGRSMWCREHWVSSTGAFGWVGVMSLQCSLASRRCPPRCTCPCNSHRHTCAPKHSCPCHTHPNPCTRHSQAPPPPPSHRLRTPASAYIRNGAAADIAAEVAHPEQLGPAAAVRANAGGPPPPARHPPPTQPPSRGTPQWKPETVPVRTSGCVFGAQRVSKCMVMFSTLDADHKHISYYMYTQNAAPWQHILQLCRLMRAHLACSS